MNKTPGLDRSGLKLSQVALDLDLHEEFAARCAGAPTNACIWTRSKATARCSCGATKPKPRGSWVDAIFAGWKAQAGMAPKTLSGRHLGPGSAVTLTERHGHSWRE
jgi:glucose-6-phosphate 1-dehydrogenase